LDAAPQDVRAFDEEEVGRGDLGWRRKSKESEELGRFVGMLLGENELNGDARVDDVDRLRAQRDRSFRPAWRSERLEGPRRRRWDSRIRRARSRVETTSPPATDETATVSRVTTWAFTDRL